MLNSTQTNLAEKYLVDDLPGAARVGARLNGILQKIDQGDTLTLLAKSFLSENGLVALLAFAADELDRQAFQQIGAVERSERIRRAKAKADEEAAERVKQTEAMDAAIKARFAAMENDPILRRKRDARELRNRFEIGYVDQEQYPRVMRLLKQVAAEKRIRPEDVAWLSTEAPDCWTEKLQQAWHRLEALGLSEEWERTGDVWAAVNASGHWRKADEPEKALEVTDAALAHSGISGTGVVVTILDQAQTSARKRVECKNAHLSCIGRVPQGPEQFANALFDFKNDRAVKRQHDNLGWFDVLLANEMHNATNEHGWRRSSCSGSTPCPG